MIDPITLWKSRRAHKELLANPQYAHWYEWEPTFLYIPKKDINGKLIVGRVWERKRYGSVLGEYNKDTHMTPMYQVTDTAYATSKDVFKQKLQDIM